MIRNQYGVRVIWLDGRTSNHWFRTPQIRDFMIDAFNRMRRDGWDGPDSKAEVADVAGIPLYIIARASTVGRVDEG